MLETGKEKRKRERETERRGVTNLLLLGSARPQSTRYEVHQTDLDNRQDDRAVRANTSRGLDQAWIGYRDYRT